MREVLGQTCVGCGLCLGARVERSKERGECEMGGWSKLMEEVLGT